LGDTEVFVDESLEVTAIVDWADAVVGDPIYDFARFVAGGPAAGPRPARMRPEAKRFYTRPQHVVNADRYYSLYQAHGGGVEDRSGHRPEASFLRPQNISPAR